MEPRVHPPDLQANRRVAAEQSMGMSEEAIYSAIERRIQEVQSSGDVLDFGAGTGQLTRRLLGAGRFRSVTGADLFPRADAPARGLRFSDNVIVTARKGT
jgi:2-polyprenyl-3-methyl-5-hydroxy-6-metoxy-1,4-benzoquinol methylase